MPSKQMEFYNQLRLETEQKAKTHQEFADQIKRIKADSKERIKKLQVDMKFIAKQVESNNELLKKQGQEIVKFL
jgi:hypothetical protein